MQACIQHVLDVHFPRCIGANVHQGDARTPGRCGCEGKQHSFLLPELGALLYTFHPQAYMELCGSIGNPSYEKLGQCVQEIEGVSLTLALRAINGTRVRNAILGVRRRLSDARRLTLRPNTWACAACCAAISRMPASADTVADTAAFALAPDECGDDGWCGDGGGSGSRGDDRTHDGFSFYRGSPAAKRWANTRLLELLTSFNPAATHSRHRDAARRQDGEE